MANFLNFEKSKLKVLIQKELSDVDEQSGHFMFSSNVTLKLRATVLRHREAVREVPTQHLDSFEAVHEDDTTRSVLSNITGVEMLDMWMLKYIHPYIIQALAYITCNICLENSSVPTVWN